MTSYETIFDCFLRKIHDVELARQMEFSPDLVKEDMIGWLHSAVAKTGYLEQTGITFDDDGESLGEDLSDLEIEYYALGMVAEWLTPLVNKRSMLAQMFTGKESNFYSQASHLSQLREMLQDTKTEIIKIKREYGYEHNEYLGT